MRKGFEPIEVLFAISQTKIFSCDFLSIKTLAGQFIDPL